MNVYWKNISSKVEALNRRERTLVLLAVLVLMWMVMDVLLLTPAAYREKALKSQLAIDHDKIVTIQLQLQQLASVPPADPDQATHRQMDDLNSQLQHVNTLLNSMQKELVSPDRMPKLLEDILKKNDHLKLISLKTLPPSEAKALSVAGSSLSSASQTSFASKSTTAKAGKLSVYRHGVELKVQGRYLDLLSYLYALEKLPWHMLWGNISLTANIYPQSTMTLTIFTLSTDQTWLSI